jgi:uncharacterized membrane protein
MNDSMTASRRIHSIDIVRGAVMVLMAIDHVRVYSGLPAGGPTPGIFFTRWVTHFCAPAFVFLAGTSAFLHGEKLGDRGALSRFLVTRGIWLILLELTVIRLAWTFNVDFGSYLLAGVIWVLGWSMIILAVLVHLPIGWIAALSLIVIFGHNLFDGVGQLGEGSAAGWALQLLYLDGGIQIGANGPVLVVLYVLIPWVVVMAAGYAFGTVLRWEADRRRRACLAIGLGAIALFAVLRGLNLYGDPRPWSADRMPALLSFLNANKYPASLLFLLMTLGPVIALLPWLEQVRGQVVGWLEVFGRVPLFYYLLHIPLIHLLAVLLTLVREPAALSWLFANHPVMVPPAPEGYVWSLGLLYAVTVVAVILLYWPCRWFADLKRRSKAPWLSYL